MLTISNIKNAVAKVGKKYGINKAYLFGSYARGDADEYSDVDIMIDRGKINSLIKLGGFENELEDELGKSVEVVTEDGVRPKLLEFIKTDRILIYGL